MNYLPPFRPRHSFSLMAAALLALPSTQALAQMSGALEEVVVTAQKREESIQDVPISMAAFTGDMVERVGGTDITTINGIAPNIILQTEGLIPNVPMFSIRGMNHSDPDPNSDPKTSMIIDGVYVPFVAGTMLDMFDIDRIEVIRGPQGTLFGKNNLAGTINVTTARPTGEFGGKVSATAGENGLQQYRFQVNTNQFANDMLSAKLAAAYRDYDGFVKNITTGTTLMAQEVKSLRGALKFEPTENFDVTLIADYTDDEVLGPGGHSVAVDEIQGDVYKAALNFDPETQTETTGTTIEANWHLDAGRITAVLGNRNLDYFNRGDFDGTNNPGIIPVQALDVKRDFSGDTQSAELRWDSTIGNDFHYVVGLYYSQDEWQQINDVGVFKIPAVIGSLGANSQDSKSAALFAQADYTFLDDWTLTVGGRYTRDEKNYTLESDSLTNGVVTGSFLAEKSDDWSNFSPRAALEYQMSDDILLYGSISQGYKGGGYNSRATLPELVGPYDEETVTAYELGIKSDWWDQRLRVNGAIFLNQYEDLQQGVQRPGSIRAESITTNVAEADIAGVELELLVLPVDNLQLGFNVGYLDAEYQDFCDDTDGASAYMPSNCGGFELEFAPGQWLIAEDQTHLPLSNAPELSASLLVDYDLVLDFGVVSFHGDVRYTDRYNTWGRSLDEAFYRDEVALVNANVSFQDSDERYQLTVYGKNLTDEEVISGAVATGANPITQFYQPPRELGVEFILNF
ncbi:TonB-dependent receptor plug domain-containing protein [Parahaliea maris]|uniref:TonB-dependent receptor plug domain-containing protein n=1 Tax=Parahaliea maris TaxID=2716870 RepID=A0A5C8ZQ85_9GAMM|nr:TonB-dependent receptor [Parahaliea maris]TXS89501.1 TonB-dependent receptor plug domain-containing protein [Parahaliea maris]